MDLQKTDRTFHITIAATPMHSKQPSLDQEIRLLKVGLLYADKVKLCSPASSFIILLPQMGNLEIGQMIEIYAKAMGRPEIIESWKLLKRRKNSKRARRFQAGAIYRDEQQFEALKKQSQEYFTKLALEAGLDKLDAAYRTGLLDIQSFSIDNTDQLVNEYFETISRAVVSGETYPLFDDFTGSMIEAAIREGKLAPTNVSVNRAVQVGLSSDLLKRLPLFEDASIDEIIDIRKELEKPLVKFRSAMIQFSRQVDNAPWNKEFPAEAEQVFREHVEPAVFEIEEACKSNKLLFSLITNYFSQETVLPAGLGVLLASGTHLSDIMALGLGAVATTAVAGLKSYKEWQGKNSEIQGNQLYFYYKAGKLLAD